MSILLQCCGLSKSFATRKLFENLTFSLFEKSRLGILGINGSGKSTLLKIMAGLESPDEGSVICRSGLKVGYVPQNSPPLSIPIKEILLEDLGETGLEGYEKELLVDTLLKKIGFEDATIHGSSLSGGWRKRLEIARALIKEPDLLLLDEPTNHLDLESIVWLEKFLSSPRFAFIVVSHDRSFLSKITTSTAELGANYPEGIFYLDVPYPRFLELRADFLEGQKQREGSLRSKARREQEWLKSNPKARTTKSSARIQKSTQLLQELATVKERNQEERVGIEFSSSARTTQKLVSLHNISYSYGAKILFEKLDLVLSPKSRLGLLGSNGSGKTTLLKILSGELKPEKGTIKYADELKIVYFDQERFRLPKASTIRTALATHGDYVRYQGREIHVNGWAKKFLFSPSLIDMPIEKLSGGEQARLLIAKLMLEPADLLLLDEPTNDLDIPTLEILEESLLEFEGAIVLISHDRTMLSRLSTQLLELGRNTHPQYFSSLSQWQEHSISIPIPQQNSPSDTEQPFKKTTKLSWKKQKELEDLESAILNLEFKLARLHEKLGNQEGSNLKEICRDIDVAQQTLEHLYEKWYEQGI